MAIPNTYIGPFGRHTKYIIVVVSENIEYIIGISLVKTL